MWYQPVLSMVHAKQQEILSLRHQITLLEELERQVFLLRMQTEVKKQQLHDHLTLLDDHHDQLTELLSCLPACDHQGLACTPQQPIERRWYTKQGVELTVHTDFQSVMEFLFNAQRRQLHWRLKNITIKPQNDTIHFHTTVVLYSVKKESA